MSLCYITNIASFFFCFVALLYFLTLQDALGSSLIFSAPILLKFITRKIFVSLKKFVLLSETGKISLFACQEFHTNFEA